jgi:Leucine-rich repeat (LRR) protein
LENLHTLSIGYSLHLKKGIENIYSLGNLKNLSFRAYKPLDKNISQLKKLEYLDIDNLSEGHFIENLYEIESLKELILHGSELRKIPEGISKLTNLERFKIMASPIKELPNDFGLLSIQYFGYNMLWLFNISVSEDSKFIPDWESIFLVLSEIKTLNIVELINSNITVLPKSICLLGQLQKLDLNNNSLIKEESFPNEILKMKNLKELKVVPNALKLSLIKELENKGVKIIT